MRLLAEARCEGEGAAPAGRAVHGDGPAHEGHQAGGDGQAQPGAPVFARGRSVLLLEGSEDRLLLLRRDADASIRHREAQADQIRGQRREVRGRNRSNLFSDL